MTVIYGYFNSLLFSTLLILIVAYWLYDKDSDLIVKISQGWVKGVRALDGDYRMFIGIPYATINRSNPFGVSKLLCSLMREIVQVKLPLISFVYLCGQTHGVLGSAMRL